MSSCLIHGNTRLIPYGEEHFTKTVEWLNNPEIYEKFGLTRSITLESHRDWFKDLKDTNVWAIYEIESGKYCGNIILSCNHTHQSSFFQVYIGDTQIQGKGIGYSSLLLVLNHAFKNLGMNRIWLQVFPDNIKAINLYIKLGFTIEGIERDSHFDGRVYKNQLRLSLLKREWKSRSEELFQ